MDVAKVSVRKRAGAVAMAVEKSGQTKRRKVGDGRFDFSSSSSLTHEKLNSFCEFPEASSILEGDSTVNNQGQFSNFSSNGGVGASCSSNGSAEASVELNFTDLEKESVEIEALSSTKYDSGESRESTPLSQHREETLERESTSETSCLRRITAEKIPWEDELEEFFAVAENKLQKQFRDKYNYDISKDEPLRGRYEWVMLKP